jgi:hypothetical protein
MQHSFRRPLARSYDVIDREDRARSLATRAFCGALSTNGWSRVQLAQQIDREVPTGPLRVSIVAVTVLPNTVRQPKARRATSAFSAKQ